MSDDRQWEAAEIAASLTTYIVGIEDVLKAPMMQALAFLIGQVDDIFDTLDPIVGEALMDATVNLPWDDDNDDA